MVCNTISLDMIISMGTIVLMNLLHHLFKGLVERFGRHAHRFIKLALLAMEHVHINAAGYCLISDSNR